MKFVGLLSGGKDSCYNIVKCIEYGHELACLGNLMPPENHKGDEMNSFMYQSAAHNVIPGLAECFGVPLVRREIIRGSVVQSLDYDANESDEVEDMFVLLQAIKEQYPDVAGVSCGAIISNYQRHRVEHVCHRLGLVPLTYLWNKNRTELLQEIVGADVDAVLVKVAGAGLDPYKHLGKSLKELQPALLRLQSRFGLDPCGEGGEYESLVLDCPAFKTKKLRLTETEIVLDEEDARYAIITMHHPTSHVYNSCFVFTVQFIIAYIAYTPPHNSHHS
jgi:diphthine-ammonia ligase